jgi:hypothetical protein
MRLVVPTCINELGKNILAAGVGFSDHSMKLKTP